MTTYGYYLKRCTRPFPSSSRSLFQSESMCEIFVMVISSNFNMSVATKQPQNTYFQGDTKLLYDSLICGLCHQVKVFTQLSQASTIGTQRI